MSNANNAVDIVDSDKNKKIKTPKEIEKELKKKRKSFKLKKPVSITNPLDAIDFSDRYFKKEHHLAFRKELWTNDS